MTRVVRGTTVDFPMSAGGTLLPNIRIPLLRLEASRGEDDVCWQVVLTPVYQRGVGPVIGGMPARRNFAVPRDGDPRVFLVIGSAGTTFETDFRYPVGGASFAVAGDSVRVDVQSTDTATVFTEVTAPSVGGWGIKGPSPSAIEPLVEWTASGTTTSTQPIMPWCRAVHVATDVVGATVTLTFATGFGNVVMQTTVAGLSQRVAVPLSARTLTAVTSLGTISVGQELAFT